MSFTSPPPPAWSWSVVNSDNQVQWWSGVAEVHLKKWSGDTRLRCKTSSTRWKDPQRLNFRLPLQFSQWNRLKNLFSIFLLAALAPPGPLPMAQISTVSRSALSTAAWMIWRDLVYLLWRRWTQRRGSSWYFVKLHNYCPNTTRTCKVICYLTCTVVSLSPTSLRSTSYDFYQNIFGGLLSHSPRVSENFFGTGQSWLFTYR